MEIGEETIFDEFRRTIIVATRNLLETKHLYQSIDVSLAGVENLTRRAIDEYLTQCSDPGFDHGESTNFEVRLEKTVNSWLKSFWEFQPEELSPPQYLPDTKNGERIRVPLPTVRVPCGNCDAVLPPHNAGYRHLPSFPQPDSFQVGESVVQVFHVPYECQSCRKEPVLFLVRREDLKLTLCGRSQFQEVSVPDFIPKNQKKFYRNAVIAEQTSFTLAAALYLRTVIEQYFYQTIPETEIKAIRGNPTGDELAELYAKTLPKKFPDSFPSLKKAYDDLSKIVHSGKEDDDTKKSFVAIRSAVDGHFKAIQLFKEMPTQ